MQIILVHMQFIKEDNGMVADLLLSRAKMILQKEMLQLYNHKENLLIERKWKILKNSP